MNAQGPIISDYTRRAAGCALGFAALVLALGCNPATTVRVVQLRDGVRVPVASAEVFANNSRIGLTDARGMLAFPSGLADGTTLVARKKIFELPGFRFHHNPASADRSWDGPSWTARVYLTSMDVDNDGTLRPLVVTHPAAPQELMLKTDNTLIGLHFLVSVIWDASNAELESIGERFRLAGEYIYNATDGQIHLEQVDIVDDNTFWNDAEYHWHADTAVWPTTSNAGGLLVPSLFGSVVEMPRPPGSEPLRDLRAQSETIAHELGHLGFGLLDEYSPAGAFCTEAMQGLDPRFRLGAPQASCVMFNQVLATKFCSNHPLNPHHPGGLQASNCWETIANAFSDHTHATAQWTIKTPDTRGGIVGRLQPGLPRQWQARINIDNRGSGLPCEPFGITVYYPGRVPAMNFPITLAVVGSRLISEGPTGADGSVTIVGAHVGDRIWTGLWRSVVATPSRGPNACDAP
jgi:hypothetical protein